jgi:NAD(P)-dependent dehydrogenase (short-subunit alcohol dehydrogenase family)
MHSDRYAAEVIRMNCVLPGIVMEREGPVRPDIEASVPLKRPAACSEIANVVAFLLSPDFAWTAD